MHRTARRAVSRAYNIGCYLCPRAAWAATYGAVKPCTSVSTWGVVTQELLTVTVSDASSGTIVCVVAGDIDLLTGPTLREKLTGAINGVPSHLVVDLSAVQFLASIGLNILVEILATQEAVNRHFALVVNDNRAVTHPLQTTGLDQVFDIYAEVSIAVEACSAAAGAQERCLPQLARSEAGAAACRADIDSTTTSSIRT